MHTKIKISNKLLSSAISLLESLDIDELSPETIQLYGYVLFALKSKICRLIDSEPF